MRLMGKLGLAVSRNQVVRALQVRYEKEYPTFDYPHSDSYTTFETMLVKSPEWSYEDEFRILLSLISNLIMRTDRESLYLPKEAVKSVCFGANIKDSDREKIIGLIEQGPFSPDLWQASLSRTSFELDFSKIG